MKGGATGSGFILALLLVSQSGCEEEKVTPKLAPFVEQKVEEPASAAPAPQSPPHLTVTESGPAVRGMSVMLTQPNGKADPLGRAKLHNYLTEEKTFLEGQMLKLVVDRMAKPEWVAIFLSELSKFSPSKITIATDTRSDFPKEVEFVPQELVSKPAPCTLVGTITEDRGSAIWKISGGTARKRGRGMGGPDLSMTADTILSMKKGCDSQLFFVTAAPGVEWGLVYDLAASGIALEKADLKQAVVPIQTATAGRALEL